MFHIIDPTFAANDIDQHFHTPLGIPFTRKPRSLLFTACPILEENVCVGIVWEDWRADRFVVLFKSGGTEGARDHDDNADRERGEFGGEAFTVGWAEKYSLYGGFKFEDERPQ